MRKEDVPAGSLVKARISDSRKAGQPFDLWGLAMETRGDCVALRVIEVVPEDYKTWRGTPHKYDSGARVSIPLDLIRKAIQPQRDDTRKKPISLLIKMNKGRIVNIYSVSGHVTHIRFADLAEAYGQAEKIEDFHRDVLVTRRGLEGLSEIEE